MNSRTSRESDLEDLIAAFMFISGIDDATAAEMSGCMCPTCRVILAMYRQVEGRIAALSGESVH